MRRVAAADGSVGRIFDGHLNGVERIAVQGPAPLRDAELAAVAAGRRLRGRVGRRARARGGAAGHRGSDGRPRGAARGQDVLLGCRRSRSRARAGSLGRGWPAALGLDRCRRPPPRGDRRDLVSLPWPGRLGLAPGGLPRCARAGPSRRTGGDRGPALVRSRRTADRRQLGGDGRHRGPRRAGLAGRAVGTSQLEALAAGRHPHPPADDRRVAGAGRTGHGRCHGGDRRRGAARARGHRRRLPRTPGRGRPRVRFASLRPRRGARPGAARPRAVPAPAPSRADAGATRGVGDPDGARRRAEHGAAPT